MGAFDHWTISGAYRPKCLITWFGPCAGESLFHAGHFRRFHCVSMGMQVFRVMSEFNPRCLVNLVSFQPQGNQSAVMLWLVAGTICIVGTINIPVTKGKINRLTWCHEARNSGQHLEFPTQDDRVGGYCAFEASRSYWLRDPVSKKKTNPKNK